MKLKYVFIIAIAVSVFASCGKITEEEGLLQLQSLPVVFSVISPLNPVQVSLSKTIVPNGSNDTIYYPSARVYVCGDDKEWTELSRESFEVVNQYLAELHTNKKQIDKPRKKIGFVKE